MGLKDKMQEFTDAQKVNLASRQQLIAKQQYEQHITITLTSGEQVTIWRQQDGYFYLANDPGTLYWLVGFQWVGPKYERMTTYNTTGSNKAKTKRTGRLIGGAMGTLIAPGIGTVIGLGLGTGNKKSTENMNQTTTAMTTNVEVNTSATMTLQNMSTNQMVNVQFWCGSVEGNYISSCLAWNKAKWDAQYKANLPSNQQMQGGAPVRSQGQKQLNSAASISEDAIEQVKRLKELLDIGAISQEEFETKKRQLLGL